MTENPLMVSHSQLGVWNRCSFKWHLGYQEGWSNKNQPIYFERGGRIHEALAEYYEGVKQGKIALGDDSFLRTLTTEWVKEGVPVELVNDVMQIVGRYIRDYSPFNDNDLEILSVEERFVMDLETPLGRPYKLQGIIDLVVRVKSTGKIIIIDHKSSGNASFRSEEALSMDTQLPSYVHLLRNEGVDVFGMAYNFLNTYNYKDRRNTPVDKLFKRISSYRTENELEVILRETGNAVDEMYDRRNSPRRSFGYDCDRCDKQELCLMTMRGIDLDRERPINFERNPAKMVDHLVGVDE